MEEDVHTGERWLVTHDPLPKLGGVCHTIFTMRSSAFNASNVNSYLSNFFLSVHTMFQYQQHQNQPNPTIFLAMKTHTTISGVPRLSGNLWDKLGKLLMALHGWSTQKHRVGAFNGVLSCSPLFNGVSMQVLNLVRHQLSSFL